MKNRLKDYFPSIWTADEWEENLRENQNLQEIFESWNSSVQKEFLDFCTGVQGIDILQGAFFRLVMNQERLSEFLSSLLGKKVRRLYREESDEIPGYACLDSNLYLEFEDGENAIAEIWKTGAEFSSLPYACRCARTLVSQWEKKQKKLGKKFRNRSIGKVCMIVLFEDCPIKSETAPETYVHRGKICFDTGISLEFLQEYYLLNLDFCQDIRREKDIQTELEGWMTFLGCRQPEKIVQLIKTYPHFKGIYQELYEVCRDGEKILQMFEAEVKSREENLDKRTMEEMEETIDKLTRQHEEDRNSLETLRKENRQKEEQITRQYQEAIRRIEELEKMIEHRNGR